MIRDIRYSEDEIALRQIHYHSRIHRINVGLNDSGACNGSKFGLLFSAHCNECVCTVFWDTYLGVDRVTAIHSFVYGIKLALELLAVTALASIKHAPAITSSSGRRVPRWSTI